MAKKLIAGGAVIAAALLYVVFGNKSTSTNTLADTSSATSTTLIQNQPTSGTDQNTSSGSNPPSSGSSSGSSNGGSSSNSGVGSSSSGSSSQLQVQYKNGVYQGSVADAVYGPLQVEVDISGGKLANVKILQAPAGGHSSEVSQFALPQLVQEAIAAQNAQVDIVSGATQTSEAFQQSLGSALQQAQA